MTTWAAGAAGSGAAADTDVPPAAATGLGVSGEVLAAVTVLALGALPALLVLPHDRVVLDVNLPLLGWLPVGIAGILVIDRFPRSLLGWTSVLAAAATPLAMLVAALPRPDPGTSVGPGWLLPLLAVAAAAVPSSGRSARRWSFWIVVWCLLTLVGAGVTWTLGTDTAYGVVATLGLLAVASTLVASVVAGPPRPVVEPLLDVALALGVVAAGALAGGLLWSFADHERIFGAEVVGAFAAAVTIVLTSPLALSLRRGFLARRYGSGALSPADLATLTGGLQAHADPRQLLATAGDLVVAASGTAQAEIVLDDLDDRAGWSTYALAVGDEQVGTLAVRPTGDEGLEERQERAVRHLVPTLGLVARAVSLAVEAEHARADVVRERQAERARILADLHDDLGPALAGMGMRVEAVRAVHPLPELTSLADDLAACRADLRRIVSALTPEALVDADLTAALDRLVSSFRTAGGPAVRLETEAVVDVDGELAVLLYRFVAEGLTNAIRHADCREILVGLGQEDGAWRVRVEDDGRGGPVVPGVGLSSLATRAADAGGRLVCEPRVGGGLCLSLALPARFA